MSGWVEIIRGPERQRRCPFRKNRRVASLLPGWCPSTANTMTLRIRDVEWIEAVRLQSNTSAHCR
jgi:hypothetical protein